MKREILGKLIKWKNRADRKPLILTGARQVGKTWVLQELGKTQFEKMAYVNFEEMKPIRNLFAATSYGIPHYWTSKTGKAEIDFIIQKGNTIVPIEVKAEENLQAKSLKIYVEKKVQARNGNPFFHVGLPGGKLAC